MTNMANNPLFKHFRQPAIYLKLPSKGKYYPDGAIDLPVTGDIPVYPMTARDELTLKTPDALMNGAGMVEVVRSCCPAIKDPWVIPTIDVDAIFIAIRLASYGEGMDIKTKCPTCNTEEEHRVDLRYLLDHVKMADYSKTLTVGGLAVKFQPQKYVDINNANIINFEEQRLIDSVLNSTELSDEEKAAKFKLSFQKLNEMNINSIAICIDSITTSDTTVSDQKQITEFLENCSRSVYAALKTRVRELILENKQDPVALACEGCGAKYTSTLTFDQSNFFE